MRGPSKWIPTALVYPGCYHGTPWTETLVYKPPTVLATGSLGPTSWQTQCLVRTSFLVHRCLSSPCVLTHRCAGRLLRVSCIRTWIPFMRTLLSWPTHLPSLLILWLHVTLPPLEDPALLICQGSFYWACKPRLKRYFVQEVSLITTPVPTMCVLMAQSCPTLCNPMDSSLPGFSFQGIPQTRILEWVAISFSRGSLWPRDRIHHCQNQMLPPLSCEGMLKAIAPSWCWLSCNCSCFASSRPRFLNLGAVFILYLLILCGGRWSSPLWDLSQYPWLLLTRHLP